MPTIVKVHLFFYILKTFKTHEISEEYMYLTENVTANYLISNATKDTGQGDQDVSRIRTTVYKHFLGPNKLFEKKFYPT